MNVKYFHCVWNYQILGPRRVYCHRHCLIEVHIPYRNRDHSSFLYVLIIYFALSNILFGENKNKELENKTSEELKSANDKENKSRQNMQLNYVKGWMRILDCQRVDNYIQEEFTVKSNSLETLQIVRYK